MASTRPKPAVLVVEDAISVRMMLAEFFAREGYEVVHARQPEVAIKRLQAAGAAVEAIVLDVFLEGNRSGLEVLELIRLDERFVNLTVVVLTGQSPLDDEDMQIIQRNRAHLLYKQEGYKHVFESLRRLVKPLARPAA